MTPTLRELFELVVRWTHVIAGIMWIGNSMLFNWLDRNLEKPSEPGRVEGQIWLLHSGGFYQVVKQQLAPSQMPPVLHWFKWQAGITWMSGVLLLVLVYFMGNGAFLLDPGVSGIGLWPAIGLACALLVGAWTAYHLLWRSPLARFEKTLFAASFAGVVAVAYGLTHVYSGRAAYLLVGAMLGTLMAGNVWMCILPSQKELVRATQEGREQDLALAKRAKQRSIHNNYMTFPVIFIMVSNHFPSTYGSKASWLVLAVLIIAGALVRHWMNIRFTFRHWIPALTGTLGAAAAALFVLIVQPSLAPSSALATTVSFAQAHAVIQARCLACHSATPTDPAFPTAPRGITFDSPQQIQRMVPLIRAMAVASHAMPLGNRTGMTLPERALLGRWIDEGAPLR